MERFVVSGGHQLSGEIRPQGAKNEALQVLCALLLSKDWVEIDNLPDIGDVNSLISMLKDVGVQVQPVHDACMRFCAKDLHMDKVFTEDFASKVGHLRGSIMLLAPLLRRFGKLRLPFPGGDRIGRRHLDTHVRGLQAMGVSCEYDSSSQLYTFWLKDGHFHGAKVLLEEASVTGTANLIMAAASAKGNSTLYHAACEPYVQQLCLFLQNLGVNIEGIGSNALHIAGKEDLLEGGLHRLQSDIIEVASFIGMAAVTASELRIVEPNLPHIAMIIGMFERLGVEVIVDGDSLLVLAQPIHKVRTFINGSVMSISDGIWPALSPDVISIGIVTALQAEGAVLFHQRMFESRLFFVDRLIQMGGQLILCDPHRVTVVGLARQKPLHGIRMSSPDIRAGIALLLAALLAEGESIIENIEQIDRGYSRIEERLRKIGAKIVREK